MLSNAYHVVNEEEALQRILYATKQKGKIKKVIKGGFIIEALGVQCFMPQNEYGHYNKNERIEGKDIYFSALLFNEKPIVSRIKHLFEEASKNKKKGDIVNLRCIESNDKINIFSFKNGFTIPLKEKPKFKVEVDKIYKLKIKNININSRKIYLEWPE